MTLLSFSKRQQALIALISASMVSVVVIVLSQNLSTECEGVVSKSGDVERMWHDGDLALIIRHTERCSRDDLNCPPGRDLLTDEGKLQAKLMGAGIRKLGPAQFDVRYSPAVRTRMTAEIAFASGQPSKWLLEDCKIGLMNKIKDNKVAGMNLLLISHSSCLNALEDENRNPLLIFDAGRDKYLGVTVLVNLKDKNQEDVLGCILPSQWSVYTDGVI
jgi:hypothetical protein